MASRASQDGVNTSWPISPTNNNVKFFTKHKKQLPEESEKSKKVGRSERKVKTGITSGMAMSFPGAELFLPRLPALTEEGL